MPFEQFDSKCIRNMANFTCNSDDDTGDWDRSESIRTVQHVDYLPTETEVTGRGGGALFAELDLELNVTENDNSRVKEEKVKFSLPLV